MCIFTYTISDLKHPIPQTTFPEGVTRPNSLTFTSIMEPLVMTPNSVYNLLCGFFFTPKISKQKVVYEIFFLKSRFPYFQLWMRDVSLLHSQTCWADETLVLGRLTGESIANISHLYNKKQENAIYLCNHSFPLILLSLTR